MKKRNIWIFSIAVWIIYSVINLTTKLSAGHNSLPWITGALITSLSGILVTYLLIKYYQVKRLNGLPVINIFFLIIIGSFFSVVLWVVLDHILSIPLWGFDTIMLILKSLFVLDSIIIFLLQFLIFFSISAFFWGEYLIDSLISQKIRTEKAVLMSENAQLKLLGLQLNPHFLFNSLSSLRSLIREDQKRAESMLTKISEFLRYSLISTKKNVEVPFSEELESVKNYIEIEQVRYGENLQVNFEIDPLSEDYPVPRFILHPIIENAVKYGMDTSPMPLKIDINSEVFEAKLKIQIINTGNWVENNINERQNGTGTGLNNVRERLKYLFPDNHKMVVEKYNSKVCVAIELMNKVGN